ncbi:MAG: type III-B CRISPR module-associated protein Cmr5 [Hyphomonadaceae bacterium]|nr:type III-B CRISPR module-associated protein Cmr5 [Hyphomonadaceae bacterium]MBC6412342.1 type III-B CRISPR module-associated protein Cmr5 [Hyphomonadaceae bacterium]
MMTMQTLDQRRAKHAWAAVQKAKSESVQDYKREAKRLPLRIQTAGLGHAVAFANAKKKANERVAGDVATWVLEALNRDDRTSREKSRQLMEQITKNDADWLRRATQEALAYLMWLSRFAEAEIADGDNGE